MKTAGPHTPFIGQTPFLGGGVPQVPPVMDLRSGAFKSSRERPQRRQQVLRQSCSSTSPACTLMQWPYLNARRSSSSYGSVAKKLAICSVRTPPSAPAPV